MDGHPRKKGSAWQWLWPALLLLWPALSAGCSDDPEVTGASGAGPATSSGGGGTGGMSSECSPGLTLCDNACVNTSADPAHCGACDKSCSAIEACDAGQCISTCRPGLTACGDVCINTLNDNAHCGGCGSACAAAEVCFAGACNGPPCGRLGFPGPAAKRVGEKPQAMASWDVDGDGKLDLIISSKNFVRLYKGAGDGTFGPAIDLNASPGKVMAAADLNGDGKLDIVTAGANAAGTGVSVILNQGAGNFGAAASYDAGVALVSLAVSDLNGDGKPDLVLGNGSGDTLSLFLNKGNGTFGAAASADAGLTAEWLSVADIDGDGKNDILATYNIFGARVLLNQGNATFAAPVSYTDLINRQHLLTDVTGDGKPDVVGVYNDKTRIAINQGGGVFAPSVEYPLGKKNIVSKALQLTDMNGDGKPDLVVLSGATIIVMPGQGNGVFGPAGVYEGLGEFYTSYFAAGDFTGDGKPDVAVASNIPFEPGVLYTLINKGDGALHSAFSFYQGYSIHALATADLNGDGAIDLAVPAGDSVSVGVLLNQGGGAFVPMASYLAGMHLSAIVAEDLNGDGKTDLAASVQSEDKLSVLLNQGDGTFGAATSYAAGSMPRTLIAADLNGDGKLDLATIPVEDTLVRVFLNNGDGTFAPAGSFDMGVKMRGIVAADFDGDAKTELAVLRDDGPITFLVNQGDGTFAAGSSESTNQGGSIATGDLNGDSRPDLVVGQVLDGGSGTGFTVRLNNGDGTFSVGSYDYPFFVYGGYITISDLNGDGAPDLAVPLYSEELVRVYLNKGDGSFDFPSSYVGAGNAHRLAAADITGDGRTDLVSYVSSSFVLPSVCLP